MLCGRVCCELLGEFFGFYIGIFGRAILIMFPRVVYGVLARVCYGWHCGIASTTILN